MHAWPTEGVQEELSRQALGGSLKKMEITFCGAVDVGGCYVQEPRCQAGSRTAGGGAGAGAARSAGKRRARPPARAALLPAPLGVAWSIALGAITLPALCLLPCLFPIAYCASQMCSSFLPVSSQARLCTALTCCPCLHRHPPAGLPPAAASDSDPRRRPSTKRGGRGHGSGRRGLPGLPLRPAATRGTSGCVSRSLWQLICLHIRSDGGGDCFCMSSRRTADEAVRLQELGRGPIRQLASACLVKRPLRGALLSEQSVRAARCPPQHMPGRAPLALLARKLEARRTCTAGRAFATHTRAILCYTDSILCYIDSILCYTDSILCIYRFHTLRIPIHLLQSC